MTCHRVRKALTEDLQRVDETQIQAHIRGCGTCAKLYRDLHAIRQLTPHLSQKTVGTPVEFAARVHRRVSVVSAVHPLRSPGLCMSVILLLALGLSSRLQQSGEPVTTLSSQDRDLYEGGMAQPEEAIRVAHPAPGEKAVPHREIILRGTSQPGQRLPVPSQIRVRSTILHEDFYLNHASY